MIKKLLDQETIILESEFTQDQLNLLRKFIAKHQMENAYLLSNTNSRYERLEKSKFFFEQEQVELEEMLMLYNDSKDEIDEILKKRENFKHIQESGVKYFLQNIFEDSKKQSIYLGELLDAGKVKTLIF